MTWKTAERQWRRIVPRLHRIRKRVLHQFKAKTIRPKSIVFILGCQRSGTSMLLNTFERDLNTTTYREISRLTQRDSSEVRFRLKSHTQIREIIDKNRTSLIVSKNLVESQNTLDLLDSFENCRVVWIYRHYNDVILSNLARWGLGNGIKDLRPIVENAAGAWQAENVAKHVREVTVRHFSEGMNPYDGAALFWFVRNSLYFDQNLDTNPDAMLCKYEDFATNPSRVMREIYEFAGHEYPGDWLVGKVHTSSIGKGRDVQLSPQVDMLCRELKKKLDQACGLASSA